MHTGSSAPPDKWSRYLQNTLFGLFAWASFSLTFLLIYALAFTPILSPTAIRTNRGQVLGGAVLMSLAFMAIGGLLGFLFGIPRTLQQTSSAVPNDNDTDAASSLGKSKSRLTVNTNLEQISDWLTKILVGVGLTQLDQIPGKLQSLALYFKDSLGDNGNLTLAVILNFGVLGFFGGYLVTRLFFTPAFDATQRELDRLIEEGERLLEAGKAKNAVVHFEKSLPQFRRYASKEEKKSFFENLVYSCLYEDPPTGFEKAIKYTQQYLAEEPATPSGLLLAYLAMAYGQQYDYRKSQNASSQELDEIKARALEGAKRSLSEEPRLKSLLRMVWDPTDPAAQMSEDNDLRVFHEDSDFKNLLGN